MSNPEQLEEALHTKKGAVNPFSLVNDKNDKVIILIINLISGQKNNYRYGTSDLSSLGLPSY
jgi:hypothetical protein